MKISLQFHSYNYTYNKSPGLYKCAFLWQHKHNKDSILLWFCLFVQDLAKGTSTGEMTYCFIQAIERGYGSTYGSLLNAMRSAVHSAENQLVTSLIDKLLSGGSYEGGETQVSYLCQLQVYTSTLSKILYNKAIQSVEMLELITPLTVIFHQMQEPQLTASKTFDVSKPFIL